MINAKTEFQEVLNSIEKTTSDIVICNITLQSWRDIIKSIKGLTSDLEQLDFTYDDGFGRQELFGLVLFNDNTWLSRGEYEGSEWWNYNKCPTVEEVQAFKG